MADEVRDRAVLRGHGSLAFLRMSRPIVLSAALLANLAGLSMAYHDVGTLNLAGAALSMAILLLATTMGHLFDEYADMDTDALSRRTLISGGSGILPSGVVPPSWALHGATYCGLGSLLLTAFGFLTGLLTFSFLAMLLAAIVLGYCYSMPPFRLIRRGWGELDNALLGTMMFLSGYLPQAGALTQEVIIRSIPVFLAIMVNLVGVHWPDREADAQVGKRTLAVRLNERSFLLFPALMAAAYSAVMLAHSLFTPEMLVAYALTLPVGLWAHLEFRRTGSPFPGSFFMVAVLMANIIGWSL